MKLVLAVIQPQDVERCADALAAGGFVSTRFATQGGFLDNANCTLMIGIEDAQVEQVLDILRERAKARVELLAAAAAPVGSAMEMTSSAMDVEVGGATVFVLPLERVEKI